MKKVTKRGQPMGNSVSIVTCRSYTPDDVFQHVHKSVDLLGGIDAFVKRGDRVLLKPNFLVGRAPEKCVNTHPEVVRAAAKLVLEAGARPIISDSPQMGSALKVAEKCGVAAVARELGIDIVEFEPVEVKNPEGKTFKHFTVGKAALEADRIINLPKLKTHGLTYLTLAVKNIFGCVPGMRKAQWHVKTSSQGNEYFSRMLLDLYLLINPCLSIVDGIVAMEGRGPGFGTPRELGLIVAGTDALSVDAVICDVLGLQPHQFPTVKVALEDGFNAAELHAIDVRGESPATVRVRDFQFPPKITEIKGFFKLFAGFLKRQLTTHPFIDMQQCKQCNSCAEACPMHCIAAHEGGLVVNTQECIQCLCCTEVCPEGAIELKDGFLAGIFKFFKRD